MFDAKHFGAHIRTPEWGLADLSHPLSLGWNDNSLPVTHGKLDLRLFELNYSTESLNRQGHFRKGKFS